MEKFIVIDTETTWTDSVMSIGAVVADSGDMSPVVSKYYILDPEYKAGGMYSRQLILSGAARPIVCSRGDAMEGINALIRENGVSKIFAYNAVFDRSHLPELAHVRWYDIMKLAAYRQYNRSIPCDAPLCSTGRLKSGYGVEAIMRMLSGNPLYCETHNALLDTLDELKIMLLLGYDIGEYL